MLKCRTLTCAPTNIAVLEVAARLRSLVNRSLEFGKYGLGDIVLFGNKKRMKVDDKADLLEVFLDHRIKILIKCLAPLSGWKYLLSSMIRLLEEPEEEYSLYLQKRAEKHEESAQGNGKGTKGNSKSDEEDDPLTFEEFVKKEFDSIFKPLNICMVNLPTHLPTSCISPEVVKDMAEALGLLKSFRSSMHSISGLKIESNSFFTNSSNVNGSSSSSLLLFPLVPFPFP